MHNSASVNWKPEYTLALFPVGATDLGGALDVAGRWPAALGYGTALFAQALVADAGAPAGVAASNTLQLTSQ